MTLPDIAGIMTLFAGTWLVSLIATKRLAVWLKSRHVLAFPNHRSSHQLPVPVGGGWVLFALAFLAWMVFHWPMADAGEWAVAAGMVALAFISWRDDNGFVPARTRMAIQIAAITSALVFIPAGEVVFANILPVWADRLLTGLCWLWFINLFNFMDGIDGICGAEILHICFGFIIVGAVIGLPHGDLRTSAVIAGAAAGFLWWNWHPARIFMGDVGAITIGFILGWQLIQLALNGQIAAAILLPLYYLVDATFTLLKRLFAKKAIWQPHKEHCYQRAANAFNSHSAVVVRIIIANLVLLIAAIISVSHPVAGTGLGIVAVTALMLHLFQIIKEE